MTEDEIQREVLRIAVSEIGKKNVASASVKPDVDFDGREVLEITAVLKPDAPRVSGDTYLSVLLKARDFLYGQGDERRPSLSLDRVHRANASTAK